MLCTTNPLMLLEIRWSECSGVGAGAVYGTGSTMYYICSTGYGVLLCTGYALGPL